jgi:hypothetical protein
MVMLANICCSTSVINFYLFELAKVGFYFLSLKYSDLSGVWWPAIPALVRQRQEEREFEASLGNTDPILKEEKRKKKRRAKWKF